MDWADRPLAAAVLASLTTGGLVGETATRLFRAGLVTPEALDLTGKAARSLANPPQMVLDTPLIPSLRSKINNPISLADYLQIVFDD